LQGTSIGKIFDATGLLVILGEPGCGKTTTLLELAEEQAEWAANNPSEQIPVIFNLSTWNKSQHLVGLDGGRHEQDLQHSPKVSLHWLDKVSIFIEYDHHNY
jgi:DNA polymerase III delta prime subunit